MTRVTLSTAVVLIIYAMGIFHGLLYGAAFDGWLSRLSQRIAKASIGWIERRLGLDK